MARATQYRDIRIVDGTGSPKLGALVELKRGAITVGMSEVGEGYYKNDAVPVGQWAVYVGAIDTGRTIPVGAGEVDAPDYENNPSSIMVTDATGNPQWSSSIPLEDAKLFVGNVANLATPVSMGGDATMSNTGEVTIANKAITNDKMRDSAGLSVLGRSANSLGAIADIVAGTDGDVLRRSGGILGFGKVAIDGVDGLQSALDDKLDLTGGTLTGGLNGTTASFTGSGSFGVAKVGPWASLSTFARYGHEDFDNGTDYGYIQTNLGKLLISSASGEDVSLRIANIEKLVVTTSSVDVSDNLDVMGVSKTNGATNHGRLASAPIALASGDSYYDTTDNIPYVWNGTVWLELTAGSAYGQLGVMGNTTGQAGINTTYQKVTQYDTNGIEEGGIVVDLPNKEIDLPAGTWEVSFSHSMSTSSSNITMDFSIFDVTDTGFASPLLTRTRKIGTGTDVGSMSGSRYVELASPTTVAIYAKTDSGSTTLTLLEGDFSVIRIK